MLVLYRTESWDQFCRRGQESRAEQPRVKPGDEIEISFCLIFVLSKTWFPRLVGAVDKSGFGLVYRKSPFFWKFILIYQFSIQWKVR
jgi:hypothetical protein